MSINDATPSDWDAVTSKVRVVKRGSSKPLFPPLPGAIEDIISINNDATTSSDWDTTVTISSEPPGPIEDNDVEHPVHYNNGNVECIEAIEAASSKEEFEGYLRGNVIKYIWRFKYKDGEKDLRKAKWYLEKLISLQLGKDNDVGS